MTERPVNAFIDEFTRTYVGKALLDQYTRFNEGAGRGVAYIMLRRAVEAWMTERHPHYATSANVTSITLGMTSYVRNGK